MPIIRIIEKTIASLLLSAIGAGFILTILSNIFFKTTCNPPEECNAASLVAGGIQVVRTFSLVTIILFVPIWILIGKIVKHAK